MRSHQNIIIWALLACGLSFPVVPCIGETERSSASTDCIKAKKVGTPPMARRFVGSPNGRHLAWVVDDGEKERLVIDCVPEKRSYHLIRRVYFSPADKFVAYEATLDSKLNEHVVVINGKQGPTYDGIGEFTISPDGMRTAYRGSGGDSLSDWVVVDGKESREYSDIASKPTFSEDSEHVGYVAQRDTTTFIVRDDVETPYPGDFYEAALSPDLKRLCGTELRWDEPSRAIWLDGIECGTYRMITGGRKPENIVWSRNSQRVGCIFQAGDSAVVLLDCKELGRYGGGARDFTFNPDGSHWAYCAQETRFGDWRIFSDRGKGPAYRRIEKASTSTFCLEKEFRVGQMQQDHYLIFGGDGGRMAYVATKNDTSRVVVLDGIEQQAHGRITDLTFSNDGQRLAYIATRGRYGGRCVVVTDGTESSEYDHVQKVFFSPDGRHVAYIAIKNDFKDAVIVIDGIEKPDWDKPLSWLGLDFPTNDSLEYLSIRGADLYRVTYCTPKQ